MNETFELEGLSFYLKRTRRRTLELRIERDGSLLIAAPTEVPLERIKQVAREKAVWIYTKLASRPITAHYRRKEYVPGEGFEYLGRSFRLRLVTPVDAASAVPLRLTGGHFEMLRAEAARGRQHFSDWYRAHAQAYVLRKVSSFTGRTGSNPTAVRVGELGLRWGSCTRRGVLNFNWRVVMAPPAVIDYVVIHELVHLGYGHHDQEFWRRVGLVIPDFRERKAWLRDNGAGLDL